MRTFFKIAMAVVVAAILIAAVNLYLPAAVGVMNPDPVPTDDGVSPDPSPSNTEGDLIISEVMSSNKGVLIDDEGNYSDWVEIRNTTDHDIDLGNYSLSDRVKKPGKWTFPNITLEANGYLLVFLSGDSDSKGPEGDLHCSFKLSSQGETLFLTGPTTQQIFSVDIPELPENVSYGFVDGEWKQTDTPTPGYENSAAGAEAFRAAMTVENPTVLINEVMTDSGMTVRDEAGQYPDWVEIVNTGDQAVNLKGYGLSDAAGNPMKWLFPDITLEAGEVLVVLCSGGDDQSGEGALRADFQLDSYSAAVTLSDARGRTLDSVVASGLSCDWSYARVYMDGRPTATWRQTSQPTPGYPNTEAGFADFTAGDAGTLKDIVISEVMTSNTRTDLEGDGQSYDYIEVANRGAAPVNIGGYSLTDNASNPGKFRFPDLTLQPGETALVLASGLSADAAAMNHMHAPFELSSLGDTLALYDGQGQLADRLYIGALPGDVSIGRAPGQTRLCYFTDPTPGQANGAGMAGIAGKVQYSLQSGVYEGAMELSLFSGEGCDIYYTTDGNTPTQNSTLYAGPIALTKTTVIRARAFRSDYITSDTATSAYFIDAAHTLPLISIVTEPELLFDPTDGIYMLGPNPQLVSGSTTHYEKANYLERGQESEVPAAFAVYDDEGRQAFAQDVAIRIQGGFSRDNQQKSFAVFARSEYGSGTMNYRFFEEEPYTQYESIQLRDGGQDALYAKIKEAVVLGLVNDKINCLTQNIKPYVVYLNGEYWGVYFMEEKRNTDFVAQHTGVDDPDSINLLYGSGLSSGPTFVKNGTNAGYKELVNYVRSHDMSQKANFDHVAEQFDTDSFMDEMINEIYIANTDYYNMMFYQIPGGKWQQILYDFCWTFGSPSHKTLEKRMADSTCASTMFTGLLKYGPWKEAFLKRFAWTMENIYPTGHVVDVIDAVAESVASEIPAERAKFTDSVRDWDTAVEGLRTFAAERPANMLGQLKSVFHLTGGELRGYFTFTDEQLRSEFHLSDEQMASLFGIGG